MDIKVIKDERLNKVTALLNGKEYTRKKRNLYFAKQRVLRSSTFEISHELKLINRGQTTFALASLVDKLFIYPMLIKLFK